jgi:hypothetical protein
MRFEKGQYIFIKSFAIDSKNLNAGDFKACIFRLEDISEDQGFIIKDLYTGYTFTPKNVDDIITLDEFLIEIRSKSESAIKESIEAFFKDSDINIGDLGDLWEGEPGCT